jgi:DNA modification methylase
VRTLADVTADPRNANRGTARGLVALDTSLREFGAARSIVLDRHGRIIAGNKTAERARELGLPLRVVRTDGRQLVAVQRDDLDLTTDVRAQRLAIADNRVGELDLEWDVDMLRRLSAEGVDLSAFWTEAEFAALLGTAPAGPTDENAVVEPRATTIQRGELFMLGRHRILCGDATSSEDVARVLDGIIPIVMITDPPYGVQYDPAWRHRVAPMQRTAVGRVTNDDRAEWTAAWRLFSGPVAYVWHAALKAGTVAADLEAAGFVIRSQIIWVKQHFALSRGAYHWQHEPAWYAVRRGARSPWFGDRTQTTVWEAANLNAMGGTRHADNAVTGHSTQKPVRVFEIPILNHTRPGETIYDPFSGSGTAVIAAEKLGRACRAIEIEPTYIQATIDRWEAFTGQRATRVPSAPAARRRS